MKNTKVQTLGELRTVKATIDEELDKLEASGVIENVPHSSWAAPIVMVPKKNG